MSSDTKLYKVAITPCGKYVHGTGYDALCQVLYATEDGGDGCSYISLKPNKNVRPGTDNTVWAISLERGEKGDQGEPGSGFHYVDITVDSTSGNPSGTATISDDTLHLGFSGLKGEDGTDGRDGADGPAGADGADGKSAYELAVEEGYTGTEEEWLASLHGADGTGIDEVEQTETSIANGGTNKVRITLTDGTYYDIQIKNGSSSNGLFPTSSALEAACPSPKVGDFAYVGSGFPANIYVCQTAGTWVDSGEDYDGDNVDLTDYAKKDELTQLEAEVNGLRTFTEEDGFFVIDGDNNIGMKYDDDGLDAAKLSPHFLSLIAGANILDEIYVEEHGLFFVDSRYNIGACIDSTGLHAINMVEHLNF